MGIIIVGGVIKNGNKYLLVQEAQEKCYGKWNIPAGHLDPNETIIEGAKREIFEESGYVVELTGIAEIANRVMEDNEWVSVIFSTKIINGEIKYDKSEILDVKWFTYDEIMAMKEELRSYDFITNAITSVENNLEAPLRLVKIIK